MSKKRRINVRTNFEDLEAEIPDVRVHRISRIPISNGNRIFAIEEWLNPTGSVFDRIYPLLFSIAEANGVIVPGVTPVIEASTGNAGASFAWCAAKLGYSRCTVIIHEDAPRSRIHQIRNLGATVVYSPAGMYAKGYVHQLEETLQADRQQKRGSHKINPERLYCISKINPMAREPYRHLMDSATQLLSEQGVNIDIFVSVVGSGTSVSGCGRRLKEIDPRIKVIVAEPQEAPTLSVLKERRTAIDFDSMPHEIYGVAAFGLPLKKLNLDMAVIDDVILQRQDAWREGCQLLADEEGKPVGRSSGFALQACLTLARRVSYKNMLIIFYDPAWKYDDQYPFLK